MFNFGALAANVLNSLDNAAKDTLEEPRVSATALRSQRKGRSRDEDVSDEEDNDVGDNVDEDYEDQVSARPPLSNAPVRTLSTSSTESASTGTKTQEATASPPKSTPKGRKDGSFGVGYALSYESNSNSSTVSNEGEEPFAQLLNDPNPASAPAPVTADSEPQQASERGETSTDEASAETAEATGEAPYTAGSVGIASEPIIPPPTPPAPVVSAPSTPHHKPSKEAPSANPTPSTEAVEAAPSSLLGNLVSMSSSSAKKLLSTPLARTLSAATTEGETDGVASSAVAGGVGGAAVKDASRDKEVLLLKKTLKKKNQDIEKLNREVLDLEEHSAALKLEVQEAWDNYKTAQEKAAAQESELQDEIRQIQKAKLADKQQAVAQLGKMGEEVAEAVRQLAAAQTQTKDLQTKLDTAHEENSHFESRISALQTQLAEAKTGTVQGVAALHEELRQMALNTEQMRVDHSSLIRQNQLRQADLERENAELTASLTSQQKEILRLQHSSSSVSNNSLTSNMDYIVLQQELSSLTAKYEAIVDLNEENERKLKLLERENRASGMNFEDEKRRNLATIDELALKVTDLENKLAARSKQGGAGGVGGSGGFLFSSASVDAGDGTERDGGHKEDHSHAAHNNMDYDTLHRELQEHRSQSQNLSKLLLKKQGAVLELQAERSALKSRLVDMQTRCNEAERQLAQARDLEGGLTGFDGYDDEGGEGSGSSSSSSGGGAGGSGMLVRRGGVSSATSQQRGASNRDTKVISDLERFGVKPGASVTRAVNMIDTWTIIIVRLLRVYPLARLGFVVYLLLLHLWVLFVLVMTTHSLELDTDPRDQLMHA